MDASSLSLPCAVGIIGGSGIYEVPGFEPLGPPMTVVTPWGDSNPITISRDPSSPDTHVAFVSRHLPGHVLPPTEVPYRANIAAFKHLGVKAIIAFNAVGSLREELQPGHFALPDQLLDMTRLRKNTFFEKGMTGHVSLADPFSHRLREIIKTCTAREGSHVRDLAIHTAKTIVVIDGPQFSTRAQSHAYRMLGADLIGMTTAPEAQLAREAEMAYQPICMVTDYDCWREREEAVTANEVAECAKRNAGKAVALAKVVVGEIVKEVQTEAGAKRFREEVAGSMESVQTVPEKRPPHVVENMAFLFPELEAH